MPLGTRPKLALMDFSVFDCKISRHLAFARRRLLKPAAGPAMAFPARIAFIHRLPLMFINRYTTLFQKSDTTTQKHIRLTTNNQPITLNYQTQTFSSKPAAPSQPITAYENSIFKTNSLTALNFFPKTTFLTERLLLASPMGLVLSNGSPLQLPKKSPMTKEAELAAKTPSPPYAQTAAALQTQKATVFQESRRTLFAQSILVHSKRLHSFSERTTVSRVRVREGGNVEVPLTLRLLETAQEKGNPRGVEGFGSGAEEHFISNQSQIARNRMKQADDEPSAARTQQKTVASDLNVLADKVYQLIERKARIERERRG
jgi:hypothetical protein